MEVDLFFFFYSSGHVGYFLESFHHLESTPIPAPTQYMHAWLSPVFLWSCVKCEVFRDILPDHPYKIFFSPPLSSSVLLCQFFIYCTSLYSKIIFFISLVIVSLHQNVSSKKSREESWTLGTLRRKQQSQRVGGPVPPKAPSHRGECEGNMGDSYSMPLLSPAVLQSSGPGSPGLFPPRIVYTLPFSLIFRGIAP